MTASSRLGLVLLIILVVWAAAYWYNVSDVTADMGREDGVALQPMDTVGVNPDEEGDTPRDLEIDSRPVAPPKDVPKLLLNDPDSEDEPEAAAGEGLEGGEDGPSVPGSEDEPDEPEIELPPPPTTFPYVVKSGDTMESIAKEWFGAATKWVLISQENPYVDPIKLRAGAEIRLPAKDASLESIPDEELKRLTEGKTYVVTRDDTLWAIAKRFYGNGSLWKIIADANTDVLPNPDDLRNGIELRIPPHQIPAD